MTTELIGDPESRSGPVLLGVQHSGVGKQRVPAMGLLCFAICCAAAFWNTVDIRTSALSGQESIGLDWQVMLKLGIAALAGSVGCYGLIRSERVRRALFGVPGIVMLALAVLLMATSTFALNEVANVCRTAAIINFGYLLFVPVVISVLGLRRTIIAFLLGLTFHVVLSWTVYLLIPSVGVFEEDLGARILFRRMGGLGHPNSIGRNAVLLGVLSLAMLRSAEFSPKWPGGRTILISLIGLAIATSLATFSRTSMLAGLAACGMLMADRILTRNGVVLGLATFVLIVGSLFAFELATGELYETAVAKGTKTGELSELTSATGRTRIWAETIRLIGERPVTGWGLNSAPVLLEDYSFHAHNAVLHVSLSGGLVAGGLVVFLLLWSLSLGLTSAEPILRAISIYVLVSGTFEDTVLDTFASPTTLMWSISLLYPAVIVAIRTQADRVSAEDRIQGVASL